MMCVFEKCGQRRGGKEHVRSTSTRHAVEGMIYSVCVGVITM